MVESLTCTLNNENMLTTFERSDGRLGVEVASSPATLTVTQAAEGAFSAVLANSALASGDIRNGVAMEQYEDRANAILTDVGISKDVSATFENLSRYPEVALAIEKAKRVICECGKDFVEAVAVSSPAANVAVASVDEAHCGR